MTAGQLGQGAVRTSGLTRSNQVQPNGGRTGACPGLDKFSLHAVVFFNSQRESRRPGKPTLERRDLTEESETRVTISV